MNIAQATIRETTSWREPRCISPRQHTGRQARWQKSEIMLVEAIARRLEPSPGGEMNGSSAPDLSFDAPVGDQPHQRHQKIHRTRRARIGKGEQDTCQVQRR